MSDRFKPKDCWIRDKESGTVFQSINAAARWVNKEHNLDSYFQTQATQIWRLLNGKRGVETVYGHVFEYVVKRGE